ncbi:type IV pili methyl-accepting chemotaxis transducer N-terminal domain-containing protein [Ralstonia pseudosolanacearum]|uniref:Sensor protein n=1 Tax=Ralstonia solanacearum TaxID=305 RepID=A0AA92K7F8_RALSL|nr:type IV pili methyl-accepting chemotaxis transducer N-terminal domain-containing protein [Ralstonia pseudosolanacearum]QOK93525.1 HAMP domain-containing protein [Ralstonia pseudosolanacearum]QOK99714.1 HAMP domain-containing protein [Ralstonia pseudosolanacearum]UWD88664.1 type IV pili methyl-accepting chemotaxis transducer N-terminal domain-containing protein [Ralstonia pseudosolanacearum]
MNAASVPLSAMLPPVRQRLSTRIVSASLAALTLVLAMIGGTLWLSWQLEGAGAAINDTGSLRMRASQIGVAVLQARNGDTRLLDQQVARLDTTLDSLTKGDAQRPLFLPADTDVHSQFDAVCTAWRTRLKPSIAADIAGPHGAPSAYLVHLPGFIEQADQLVRMIEQSNAHKTTLLRLSQFALAAMASVGSLAMIYLLYLWIILPVLRLQDGLQRMAAREFTTRLTVESYDEFGLLAHGFNRMAEELQGLYADLASRVARKTEELAEQNRELSALYDITAFLNISSDIDAMCRGFLQRVTTQFGAAGGSIRVMDPDGERLHLVSSVGLPAELEEAEQCMRADTCLCGQATQQDVVIVHDFHRMRSKAAPAVPMALPCQREGYTTVAVFRILTQQAVLGTFSLHLRDDRQLPPNDLRLLETLGQHLGIALENLRLQTKATQLAVVEERNLVAQGLHDSIAQGLNFLNLQVQMLDTAMQDENLTEARETVPLLRCGVEECYQDVRELLLNFRSKLETGELRPAVEQTLARFARQSGVVPTLRYQEIGGAPLPADQQLQVLFILQEALSNVRKHAMASRVDVAITNGRDFELRVEDDGRGYDAAEVAECGEAHIGLNIMRERAAWLSAQLRLEGCPGQGASVILLLPGQQRQAA